MKQENDIPDKILERIRKLVRLKESTTSEGEAKAAATHVNRLLKEYNLSLLDVNEKRPETVFEIRESGAISYKDSFGNYWKRDLLRVLCEYNYCRMLRYRGTTDMLIVGTQENIAAVTVLYDYLRTTFRRLADKRHMEYVSIKRGYYRTEKYRKKYIRSYLEGVTPGLSFRKLTLPCRIRTSNMRINAESTSMANKSPPLSLNRRLVLNGDMPHISSISDMFFRRYSIAG